MSMLAHTLNMLAYSPNLVVKMPLAVNALPIGKGAVERVHRTVGFLQPCILLNQRNDNKECRTFGLCCCAASDTQLTCLQNGLLESIVAIAANAVSHARLLEGVACHAEPLPAIPLWAQTRQRCAVRAIHKGVEQVITRVGWRLKSAQGFGMRTANWNGWARNRNCHVTFDGPCKQGGSTLCLHNLG